jgi:hypothetical protein
MIPAGVSMPKLTDYRNTLAWGDGHEESHTAVQREGGVWSEGGAAREERSCIFPIQGVSRASRVCGWETIQGVESVNRAEHPD